MNLPLNQSLQGRTIVVTRARHQAGKLSDALRELGAEVIELPVIEIVPPASYLPLDEALRNRHLYQWVIFTSANAVRVAAERIAAAGMIVTNLGSAKMAAIGPATAAALKHHGLPINLVPESYIAEGMVKAFQKNLQGARILLIRARIARDVIPDALRSRGAVVDVVDAYETVMPQNSAALLPQLLTFPPDAVTFTSSSTVRNFLALMGQCNCDRPTQWRAISIGPVTSETLRHAGWEPFAEATQSDVPGLVDAVVRALQ